MDSVRMSVLGGFGCRVDGRELVLAPRAERVLAYLALHRRAVRRDQLAGALWADAPDERAAANLRSALWRLPRTDAGPLVDTAEGQVALAGHVTVDLWSVEAGSCVDREPHLSAGDLLPGWDDDWVLGERERYRQLRLHALEELSADYLRRARYGDALRLGLTALADDPLRETAQRRVIEVHIAEGNAGEALRQYGEFRRVLHDALGLPPSAATRALIDDLVDGRPAPARRREAAPAVPAPR